MVTTYLSKINLPDGYFNCFESVMKWSFTDSLMEVSMESLG